MYAKLLSAIALTRSLMNPHSGIDDTIFSNGSNKSSFATVTITNVRYTTSAIVNSMHVFVSEHKKSNR